MRRRTLHAHHEFGKINVTPMIDVVMCLIIFYLIVGKLAMDRRITLPTTTAGITATGATPIIIEIAPPDSPGAPAPIIVAGQTIAPQALEELLRGAAGDSGGSRPVQIRAGRELPYAMLSPVLQACRKAGLTSVRLMTERAR